MRYSTFVRCFLVIILILGYCGAAQAACKVSQHLDEDSPTAHGSNFGQSFTAPCSGVLTTISVKTWGASTDILTINIYNGQSLVLVDRIHTQSIAAFPGAGVHDITLSTPIRVTGGSQYTFQLLPASGTIQMNVSALNPYAGGQYEGNGFFNPGADLYFDVNITDPLPHGCDTCIPTLSEWGMIIFGVMLGLWGIVNSRKRGDAA
ncbi:MAG: IPTL-CTERM sorting domain-containing protein [Deltaproteobacteria bacterium]|nr:IPTL-CTERM sorting domain-containing protein [Deltaproteobacteria bacterium]